MKLNFHLLHFPRQHFPTLQSDACFVSVDNEAFIQVYFSFMHSYNNNNGSTEREYDCLLLLFLWDSYQVSTLEMHISCEFLV